MNLDCPYCSRSLQADDSLAGGKAQCPFCAQKFFVDYAGRCIRMDDLVVFCPACSERIVLGRDGAGGKSACPVCGQRFIVSAADSVSPPREAPVPPASGGPAAAVSGKGYVAPQIVPAAGGAVPPPPESGPVPVSGFSAANRIADICLLGIVICFTAFCMFRCAALWAQRGTRGGRLACISTVKQITAECCHFAADHQDRFPTAEEWREIVMPYLPQAKNLPCVEHYRYEGTGRKLCDKESGTKPVIYCDTHKIVAFTSGFCNIDSSYFSKQDSVRSATKEQKKWGFPE